MNKGVKGTEIRWKHVPQSRVQKTSGSLEWGLDGVKGMWNEHIVLCRNAECPLANTSQRAKSYIWYFTSCL